MILKKRFDPRNFKYFCRRVAVRDDLFFMNAFMISHLAQRSAVTDLYAKVQYTVL
jgi:hypothetical protein